MKSLKLPSRALIVLLGMLCCGIGPEVPTKKPHLTLFLQAGDFEQTGEDARRVADSSYKLVVEVVNNLNAAIQFDTPALICQRRTWDPTTVVVLNETRQEKIEWSLVLLLQKVEPPDPAIAIAGRKFQPKVVAVKPGTTALAALEIPTEYLVPGDYEIEAALVRNGTEIVRSKAGHFKCVAEHK